MFINCQGTYVRADQIVTYAADTYLQDGGERTKCVRVVDTNGATHTYDGSIDVFESVFGHLWGEV